jgi:norsolorinic acid ketoreductase
MFGTGNAGAVAVGMQEAPLTVDQSVNGMVHILDTATREKYGGQTINYDGEVIPY